MGGFAWVTLATNDSYSLGALVLAHSLKSVGTTQQLAVLITPGVTNAMREKLQSVYNLVQEVNILDSRDEANLKLLKRPELGVTFTKLHCWRLTQYEKCVFLDADTLVLQNCDELFEREELSAAPDVGWPDCFNSGVFVYRPSRDTFEKLIQFALDKGSFDGGDQGLLNLYFSDWAHKDINKHLPFIYNMCSTACYSYLPAYKQFGSNAKIIHFIGATKPWLQYFNTETRKVQPSGDSGHLRDVLQRWWDIFCSLIHPQLSPDMPEGRSQQYYPNPSFFQSYCNPSNQTTQQSSSASDFQIDYDPWDEYDQKQSEISQSNNHIHTSNLGSPSFHDFSHSQPNEPPNTNASFVAEHHSHHSQPQTHDASIHHTNQHHDNSTPSHDSAHHHQPQIHQQSDIHHTTKYNYNLIESHTDYQHHHNEPQVHQHEDVHHSTPSNHEVIKSHNNSHQNSHSQPYSEHIPPKQSVIHNAQHTETHFHDPPPSQPHSHNHSQHQHHNNPNSSFHNENIQNRSPCPSPKRESSPIPEIPNECKATDIVSNEVSVAKSTEEHDKTDENAGLAGAFARLTLGVARTPEQDAFENVMRKQAWEVGNIDYMGKDSFDNIWSKISETLATAPVAAVPIKEAGELPKEVPKDTPAKSETAAPVESPRSETPFPVSAKIELPATPAVTDTVVSPPVQTLEPLKQEEPSKAEACIVTAVSATEIPSPTAELESESQTPAVEAERNLFGTKSEERIATQSAQPVLKDLPGKIPEQQIPESPQPEEKSTSVPVLDSSILQKSKKESSTQAEKPKESFVPVQAASEDIKSPVEEIKLLEQSKEAEVKGEVDALLRCNKPETAPSVAPLEGTKAELESVEVKPVSEIPTDSTKPELGPVEVKPVSEITTDSKKSESEHTSPQVTSAVPVECKKTEPQSAEFKSASVEVKTSDTPSVEVKSEVVECQKTEINIAEMKSDSKPEPLESSSTQESQPKPLQEVPQSKVTEPTPPITPSTPPLTALPQFEKVKQALAVESNVPDTPPPSSSQDSSPTPPPRKEGKPKKVAASKPKK